MYRLILFKKVVRVRTKSCYTTATATTATTATSGNTNKTWLWPGNNLKKQKNDELILFELFEIELSSSNNLEAFHFIKMLINAGELKHFF